MGAAKTREIHSFDDIIVVLFLFVFICTPLLKWMKAPGSKSPSYENNYLRTQISNLS